MLIPVKNILLATDLSENAGYALRFALSTATANGAKVHVLHVVEPLSQDALVTLRLFGQANGSQNDAVETHRAATKEALKANQKTFIDSLAEPEQQAYSSVVSSVEFVDGHPAESILKRAKSMECDVIVMATHEQTTHHTFLGTVVKKVLRRSSIPVLVVPPPTITD